MDRSFKIGTTTPSLALAVSTALVSMALAGCTTTAPRGDVSFSSAQTALAKGQVDKAILHAEAAVLAEPRKPGFRALLGAAYLEAGRFQSAATSFDDALQLGDENPRTVLSFALAKIALGEGPAAVKVLDEFARLIDPADLGLALALAGQPERGVHVLTNAVRTSEPTVKLRQNLAYAYALAGNWRAARVMAAEDVPPSALDQRLTDWAAMAAPEKFQQRVAVLLGITPRYDEGQPQTLALANFPSADVMFAEAEAEAQAADSMFAAAPASNPQFADAFAEPAIATAVAEPAPSSGVRFVSNPVVQPLPGQASPLPVASQRRMAATAAAPVAPKAAPAAAGTGTADNSHLVQLGSYNSKAEATRGWDALQRKFPQLSDHDVVITEAVVKGRTFWRVAAAGFGANSAKSMCSTFKSAGQGCFAYAAANPPAGAVDRGVRMAARGR